MTRKQEDFNRKLRKEPKNVSLWLEFARFQDEIFKPRNSQPRKLIERKISILKKAIEFNCGNLEMILFHMTLAEEIEDSSTLMKLWEGYLKRKDDFVYSDYFKLKIEWLNFLQNRFLAFSFDQVNEAFSEAFRNLHDPALYKTYFKFLRRCGFTESIVAISQASIEVNAEFFNYGEVDLEAYEDQWESGLMDHIGDSVFRDKPKPQLYPKDQTFNKEIILLKWLQLERYRESNFWHPLHFDEDDCEGQVIFDDIKDFLILPTEQSDSIAIISSLLNDMWDCLQSNTNPLNNFLTWYVQVCKELLPFFRTDWKFIYRLFVLMPQSEAETFAKHLLSENRDSLECFMAYGKFQETIGNTVMADKVYESIRKRSKDFDFTESVPKIFEDVDEVELEIGNDYKSSVYEVLRSNPGNKQIYMRIIESIMQIDDALCMEVFNLIDEQQLRIHSLLEEI